jgi:hypothetical protein
VQREYFAAEDGLGSTALSIGCKGHVTAIRERLIQGERGFANSIWGLGSLWIRLPPFEIPSSLPVVKTSTAALLPMGRFIRPRMPR